MQNFSEDSVLHDSCTFAVKRKGEKVAEQLQAQNPPEGEQELLATVLHPASLDINLCGNFTPQMKKDAASCVLR